LGVYFSVGYINLKICFSEYAVVELRSLIAVALDIVVPL